MTLKLNNKNFESMKQLNDLKHIFYCLGKLEELKMNKSATARLLKISRPTIMSYHSRYWKEYLRYKNRDNESVEVLKTITVSDGNDVELVKQETLIAYRLALKKLTDRLKDEIKPMSDPLVLDFVKNVAPYVIPKPGEEEPNKGGTKVTYNSFIQIFKQKMEEMENL